MAPIDHMGTAGVPGSAGRIVPNTLAKIVKLDGSLAGFDEPGELVVSGPQMALRYANNEKACVGPLLLFLPYLTMCCLQYQRDLCRWLGPYR